jgi:hypothetical protein
VNGALVPSSTGSNNAATTGRTESHGAVPAGIVCNCKRSKCLKMYCDCFRYSLYCGSVCKCNDCANNLARAAERQEAIDAIVERNPEAFHPRVKEDPQSHSKGHLNGCHCRKSSCLKKYCECFTGHVPCTARCRCVDCKNVSEIYRDSSGFPIIPSSTKLDTKTALPEGASPVGPGSQTKLKTAGIKTETAPVGKLKKSKYSSKMEIRDGNMGADDEIVRTTSADNAVRDLLVLSTASYLAPGSHSTHGSSHATGDTSDSARSGIRTLQSLCSSTADLRGEFSNAEGMKTLLSPSSSQTQQTTRYVVDMDSTAITQHNGRYVAGGGAAIDDDDGNQIGSNERMGNVSAAVGAPLTPSRSSSVPLGEGSLPAVDAGVPSPARPSQIRNSGVSISVDDDHPQQPRPYVCLSPGSKNAYGTENRRFSVSQEDASQQTALSQEDTSVSERDQLVNHGGRTSPVRTTHYANYSSKPPLTPGTAAMSPYSGTVGAVRKVGVSDIGSGNVPAAATAANGGSPYTRPLRSTVDILAPGSPMALLVNLCEQRYVASFFSSFVS